MNGTAATSHHQIKWRQVWSLVALDIAIIISWIAYHKYQPKLIANFGFAEFTLQLAIIQGIILFLTPPIAGYFADRIRKQKGERLPVVNVGITFVSMVFMVVAFTVFANPSGWITYLVPVMIVLWLISMNIFHSPAISTVELFVPPEKLPQVMAIFAVIASVAESIEPSIVDLIDLFGAPLTFAIGGILVFTTGYFFQKETKNLVSNEEISSEYSSYEIEKSNFPLVFGLGVALGIVTTFFFNLLPDVAKCSLDFVGLNGIKGSFFASIIIAIAALLSYPMSKLVEKYGVKQMAIFSTLAAGLIISSLWISTDYLSLVLFILLPIAFATMTVSYLPLAFMRLSNDYKVLGIGLFFSGVELANSLVEIFQAAGIALAPC